MKHRYRNLKLNKTHAEKKRGKSTFEQKNSSDENYIRADEALFVVGLARSRSQGADLVRRGLVKFSGRPVLRPSKTIPKDDISALSLVSGANNSSVSRAGDKLASASEAFKFNFKDKVVLDVGSSTGGFTQFSLSSGAKKVIAVEVGTNQMVPELRADERVELHEKTDIRDFSTDQKIDAVVIDASFISLTKILPSLLNLSRASRSKPDILAMAKPQFEGQPDDLNAGVVKNSSIRRQILKNLEAWLKLNGFVIKLKQDNSLTGKKGNQERFYWLTI
jgi:23S rRNA (cytidine1920-2'-O)/16S rRNA (cytidine1409-2'-O)-methyltransferase